MEIERFVAVFVLPLWTAAMCLRFYRQRRMALWVSSVAATFPMAVIVFIGKEEPFVAVRYALQIMVIVAVTSALIGTWERRRLDADKRRLE